MKRFSFVFLMMCIAAVLSAQEEKVLYFEWTSIPAYTTFTSTEMLEPGHGEIGFGVCNFYLWGPGSDTTSYDTRTHDLLFRIGVIPHMEFGIKYSSPRAVVLDVRGGFEAGRIEFTGSAGFGYMKATKFVQPGNNTLWLYDGYPTISAGYELFPWLRLILSGKGIISHYVREQVDSPQNFTTYHAGFAITLEVCKGDWCIRPDYNRYWAVTHYTLREDPINFKAGCLGICAVYRPQFKDKD